MNLLVVHQQVDATWFYSIFVRNHLILLKGIKAGGDSIKGGSRNFQNLCICSSEVAYCKAWVVVKGSVEILNKNFGKAK